MQDKMLYLIAVFDEETQRILKGYYNILCENGFVGTQIKDSPYHFTLGSCNPDEEVQLISKLESVCSKTSCFDICFGYAGLFGLNVLFIAPNINFELLEIRNSFFPQSGFGFHNWAAHATLLMDEPEEILRAVPIISNKFSPFKATVERLEVYEFFPKRFVKSAALIH